MGQARTLIFGCGYLGRRAARLLLTRGDHVFGTTRTPARGSELAALGIEPVLADVLDPSTLDGLPEVDAVLYCVGFDRSAGRPIPEVYVGGLSHALDRLAGRVGTLVHASSTGVYGGDHGDWVDETSPTDPRTESGRACLEGEGLVRDWEANGPGRATILRFSGLYGPGRVMRRDSLLRGEPVVGDPEKFLNLIHIDDAASASVAALDAAGTGALYLISDDRPSPRREFYARVAEALGAPPPRFRPPAPGSPESSREGSNKRVSNRRMHADLGVALRYPDIEAGVPAALLGDASGVGS